jgi:hypothetical protein
MLLSKQAWEALLTHELVHCNQFKCNYGQGTKGPGGGWSKPPHSYPPTFIPEPLPKGAVPTCGDCQKYEDGAYAKQCKLLFPYPKDQKDPTYKDLHDKYLACKKKGSCYSCKKPCENDKTFIDDCIDSGYDFWKKL